MLDVKRLRSFYESLSRPNVEASPKNQSPIKQYSYKQSVVTREISNNLVQTGEPDIHRQGNCSVEKSENESLLCKIYNKIPDLFKGQESKPSVTDVSTRENDKIQRPPKEGVENLLGSNRNIAYLVGDDQGGKENVAAGSCKDQMPSNQAFLRRQAECLQVKRGKSKSESSNQSRHDSLYNNNEVSPGDGHIYRKDDGQWKSDKTDFSSGYFTGSISDWTNVPEEKKRTESDCCRTKTYVKKTRESKTHFNKYPSEPTVVPQPKKRTLTQENILNLSDSSVGLFTSGNESVTVSQTSVFSSSEQETRDALAEHTKDCLKEREKCLQNQDVRRLKKVREVFEKEGLVIILGNDGSGSTDIAWTILFESNSKEKYNLLEVSSDFAVCMHSKESVTILVDNAFGESKLQETALETCLKYAKLCKQKKSSKNLKLIFTVNHHIADQCKRQLDDFRKNIVDLEDPKLRLTSDEMLEISKAIVHNSKEELKVDVITKEKQTKPQKGWQYIPESLLLDIAESALPSGFPKKFKKFLDTRNNLRQGLRYFTSPSKDLLEEFTGMKKSKNQDDLAKYLTLIAIAVCGEKLKLDDIVSIEQSRNQLPQQSTLKKTRIRVKSKTKAKLIEMEIPWWIEIVNHYAKNCSKSLFESVKTGLDLLKTSYVKEEGKGVFVFAAPSVRNAILITIGQDFPQYILKLSDTQFFKEFICTESYFAEDGVHFIGINTSNVTIQSEANARLVELFDSGDIEAFSNHKLFRDKIFTQQFLDSFGKTHELTNIFFKKSTNENSKCVISCALQNKPNYLERKQNNLAKSIILHKAWKEKRKSNRQWTSQKELEVILYCCKYGDEDTYLELRSKYNVHVNCQCLQEAIRSGSYPIVEEIMRSIAPDIADHEKCECMKNALFEYTKYPSVKRRKVVNILQRYISVDYKIKGVSPVIHYATEKGDASFIVTLEHFGGDINVTNEHGETILHEALRMNKVPFLDLALGHGADQRKADKHGMLPVHECAKQNKSYPLQLLMKKDRNIVSAKDNSGRQPLHHAAINNSYEAANCLIRHGAEVDAVDGGQKTPLHYAAESGKGAVLHILLEAKADINKLDENGQTPWIIACKEPNLEGIKRLLKDDMVDVNVQINQIFPIHVAASTGNISAFKKMLEKGARINERTVDTWDTVLHIAIKHGHNSLVKAILELDASLVDCRNKENEVPLHTAAWQGNLFAVDALLKTGADRSPINKRSQTPKCIINQKLESKVNTEAHEKYYTICRILCGLKPMLETTV